MFSTFCVHPLMNSLSVKIGCFPPLRTVDSTQQSPKASRHTIRCLSKASPWVNTPPTHHAILSLSLLPARALGSRHICVKTRVAASAHLFSPKSQSSVICHSLLICCLTKWDQWEPEASWKAKYVTHTLHLAENSMLQDILRGQWIISSCSLRFLRASQDQLY